jgi:glucose-6-phosphate dehydrogenase assembly protein OpcA
VPEVPLREIGSLDEFEDRLREISSELRRDGKTVLRACKMTLVVVAAPGDSLEKLLEDLGSVTDVQPGRVIVVTLAEGGGSPGLRPWIAAHCHLGAGGHPVCTEQFVLEARGEAQSLVRESVLRLLVSDMPVFVWWRAPLAAHPLLKPILEVADRFIVNSAGAGDAFMTLPFLARITWGGDDHVHVGDLAWMRTDPWREIVASMFDAPEARSSLERIGSLHIECRSTEGACASTGLYLAGWMASRLGWTVEGEGRARRADGGLVEIHFGSGEATVPGRITRVRLEAEGAVIYEASRTRCDGPGVRVTGHAHAPRLRRVQALDDLALLHGELQRDARDPIFEAALRAAAALTDRPATP